MEGFPIFYAGDIEEALGDVDDGVRGGKGSGRRRCYPAHLGRHEMEEIAEFPFFPQAGVADFLFHGFEIETFVIRGESGNKGHVGSLCNGDIRHILFLGKYTAGLDGSPAAVHEEKALSFPEEGCHLFYHRFVVRGMGADHEDIRFLTGLFEVRYHGHKEGGIHPAPDGEGRLIPERCLHAVPDKDLTGDIFQVKKCGGRQGCAAGTDDCDIHSFLLQNPAK